MIKAKKMPQNIIQKCAEVARKCINAFWSDPLATILTIAFSMVASLWLYIMHFFVIFIACMVDVWTGFVEVRRDPELEDNSDGLKKKGDDLFVYWGVMSIPAALSFIYPELMILSWGVFGFFLWVEGKSIVENMRGAGFEVKYLARALDIFEGTLQSTLERLSNKKE